MRRFQGFAAALALVSFFPTAGLAEEPEKGDLIDSSAEGSFRGWNIVQKALGIDHIPFVVFEKSGIFLVAGSEPVKRTSTGGFEIERLLYVVKVIPSPNDTVINGFDCGFLGLTPALALFDEKMKIATGYFVVKDEVLKRRWIVDDPEFCSYGGD